MFARCCDQNRPSHLRRSGLLFATLIFASCLSHIAFAHTPFESSARVTVFTDHIEAAVTSGTGLAGELLKDTGIDPTKASGFAGAKAAPEISHRIIGLEADGQSISAESVKLMGDGLEAMLVVTFPRPAAGGIKLSANYASHVPSGSVSPLVIVDEQGRMLGSHLVTSANNVMEFQLAATVPTIATADTTDQVAAAPAESEIRNPKSEITQTPSFLEYLKLGVHHIVTGYDHLLFLCGLLVGCKRVGPMLAIITCFTLAHSITLALAAMNVVAISPRIVEPIIAASIIFVGLENFRRGDNVKARCWLALGFGLIHGFGFAGALRETGLGDSAGSLVSALFSFNLGVELGQLVIAAIFLGALWQLRQFKPVEQYATPVISAVVIALGGWWLVERTLLS